MINPEFQRNLWLQLSIHRLVAMPVLLGLAFLAAASGTDAQAVGVTATTLYILIVYLWGTRNASASIIDEMRDKTWDQQRMSAMQPWDMTWGKLFGATAFNWYGGAICLFVLLLARQGGAADSLVYLFALLPFGVFLHAAVLALNLHVSRFEPNFAPRGGLMGLIVLIILPMSFGFVDKVFKTSQWWGHAVRPESFVLASGLLFAGCAVFGAWRTMSSALQVRTLPWAWPLFAVILTLYAAGFGAHPDVLTVAMSGLLVAASMTYFALFSEAGDVAIWRRVVLRLRASQWRDALEHMPIWPTTLVLTFCFALASVFWFAADAGDSRQWWPAALGHLTYTPLILAGMVLRDVCVFQFFAFAEKPKRVAATVMLYLLVIDGLLPFLAQAMGLSALRDFLLPFAMSTGVVGVAVMAIHVAIAGALVAMRWKERAGHMD